MQTLAEREINFGVQEQLLQYNTKYDQHETDPQFITTQIETHLRERFNVLVSTVEYGIADGHLVRKGKKEPFINSIKRGRDIIQKLSSNSIDFERENAEVIGFGEKIDPFLSSPQTSIGSKMLNISLQGGKYQHNFYDIFTVKERSGERYVELSRYSSALSAQDYATRFSGLDPENPPTAAEFLANPIIITDIFITAEQIHQMLHEEHEYMKPSEFDEIWKAVSRQPFFKSYLLKRDARSFNAIINFADEVWENIHKRDKGEKYRDYIDDVVTYSEIRSLEERNVRQVSTPCPGKSGADINNSPRSVSEFGSLKDDLGDREFECPACKHINVRPYNEKISLCQNPMCPDPTKVACA